MARKSKRKPTISQCLVGVATVGMPPPVRSVLGSRFGSLLAIIALPVLVISGVISIQWNSGVPEVSIDRQRAKEIKAEAISSVEKLRDQDNGLLSLRPRFLPQKEAAAPEPPKDGQPIANLSEILKTLR